MTDHPAYSQSEEEMTVTMASKSLNVGARGIYHAKTVFEGAQAGHKGGSSGSGLFVFCPTKKFSKNCSGIDVAGMPGTYPVRQIMCRQRRIWDRPRRDRAASNSFSGTPARACQRDDCFLLTPKSESVDAVPSPAFPRRNSRQRDRAAVRSG